jgi:protocatechuate 3,4-dioxygenase beta subunit
MRARRDALVAASLAALALGPDVAGAQLGAVHGVVYDSLTHRPLAGATVQSVRASDLAWGRSATTDSAGAFRIDSLAPGRYLVGFAHPLLELLRVEATPRLVELGPGGEAARVDLGVPDLARVRPVVCGSEQAPTDSSGLLAGRVRDAVDDAPVARATVVITWSEHSIGAKGVRTERRRVPVTTGPGGRYLVCGVPFGEELIVSAAAPGRASGEVALELPPRGFAVRDLTVGDSVAESAVATRKAGDTTAALAMRGTARLTGTVRDSAGRPVRGARVSVRGAAASAAADADGAFTLGGLPSGTRTLEVRAIGFTLRRMTVDLAAGRAGTVDVRLDRVTNLDPVTVFGTPSNAPVSSKLAEFLDRQRHNPFGRFITAAEIERRNPIEITDAFHGMAGVQIVPNGRSGKTILGRGGKFGTCQARVVLDGMLLQPDDELDRWVSPDEVAGIEVYLDATFAPPQYGNGRPDSCSIVLVWTH